MYNLDKRWQVAAPITDDAALELGNYSPIMRQILFNRGIETQEAAKQFLKALPPEGIDPTNMRGIPEAVDRIHQAIENHEKIVVYGDYDADGVTATALLTQALRSLGADVDFHIPDRFEEGYGLNKDALYNLYQAGNRLAITVDCGIRSLNEVEYAQSLGLDMIISDHHHPGEELPPAIVVVNPKQAGDSYPEKNLAGVGIAYKLACALYGDQAIVRSEGGFHYELPEYMDLVALGTIADLVPLTGENRFLARKGLHYINHSVRQGLQSLIGAADIKRPINSGTVGFQIGPRLNAAGRLESALMALELLIESDVQKTGRLAQLLNQINSKRQQLTRETFEQAEQVVLDEDPDALLLFAVLQDCDEEVMGIVGLSASQLCERFYRPSIVAYQGEEFTRASCRSIPEFHITQALDECADLFEKHGGHAAAAGFTVKNENLPELKARLKAISERELGEKDLRPVLVADAEIYLPEMNQESINELLIDLEKLQPTGQMNPSAKFISRNLQVKRSKLVGRESTHLKLTVSDGNVLYDAIAFKQGYWYETMPPYVDLFYQLEINEWNGRKNIQFNVRDIKPSSK
jgi:single-stranded-DNA-specific exonuclease